MSCVSLVTSKTPAGVPPNLTPVVPVKPAPVRVTAVPRPPVRGDTSVTEGAVTLSTVKSSDEWAVPEGVCTDTGPLVVPEGDVAVSFVSPATVKGTSTAGVPMSTTVAPDSPEPVRVTTVPGFPREGETLSMRGAGSTLKAALETPVPRLLVTRTGPEVVLKPSPAVSCPSSSTLKQEAGTPSNVTAVAPVNPEPVTVTSVPSAPEVGVKAEMEGTWLPDTVKPSWVAVPLGVTTVMGPEMAPPGTVTMSSSSDTGENDARISSLK